MEDNNGALKELRKVYLSQLKHFFESENQKSPAPLREYFQYLHNSIDSSEAHKQEDRKLNKIKLNENLIREQRNQTKRFDINWNLEYCEACKLDYWPSNCTVYIKPKCRITNKGSKLYTKYKLLSYKPKYKSYKDRLLKNILNKGITLVYECKRCKSKNLIVNEVNRQGLKEKKLNKNENKKSLLNSIKNSQFAFNNKSAISIKADTNGSAKPKPLTTKKKFQSLQTKLKQNELEQERLKQQKNSSFGSLADFLQQLT